MKQAGYHLCEQMAKLLVIKVVYPYLINNLKKQYKKNDN